MRCSALALACLAALLAVPACAFAADPLGGEVAAANSIAGPLLAGDAGGTAQEAKLTASWLGGEATRQQAWAKGVAYAPPEEALATGVAAVAYAQGQGSATSGAVAGTARAAAANPVGTAQDAVPPIPLVPGGPLPAPPGLEPAQGAVAPALAVANGAAGFAGRIAAAGGADARSPAQQCLHWTGSAVASYAEGWAGGGPDGAWGMAWITCRGGFAAAS